MERTIPQKQNNTLVSILFFSLVDLLLSALFSSFSISIVGAIGTLIIFLLQPEIDSRSLRLFILVKILTVLSVLLSYYNCEALFSHPYYIGGSDDLHSETDAFDFIKYHYIWPWDWPMLVKDKGFIWILANLIRITGIENYHTVAFRILNMDILIATAVLCYRISRYRFGFDKKKAVLLFAVLALFPNSLYISSFVFRDTICSFLMLMVFALCDDLFKKKEQHYIVLNSKLWLLLLIALCLFLSFWLRPEALLFDLAIIGLSVLRDNTIKGRNVLYVSLAFILVLYIFNSIGAFDLVNETIDAYSEFRLDETQNSNNSVFKLIFTLPILPFGIILRVVWGLLSPLPTQLANLFTIFSQPTDVFGIIVALGMIPYYYYMPFFFKGVARVDKYMLTFLIIFGGYIVSTFTFRHVMLFYPFFWMILIRSYFILDNKERKKIKNYSLMILLMLPVLYMITKIL